MSFASGTNLLAITSNSEVGTIFDTSNSTLPTGCLYCNGETKNTADYPELAAALGASGATFDLPFLVNEKSYSLYASGGSGDVEVTLTSGGGTLDSDGIDGTITPYIDSGGNWRAVINFEASVSSTARTVAEFTVAGLSTPSYYQAITAHNNAEEEQQAILIASSSGAFKVFHPSASATQYTMSGDIALASKPSFVLDNSPANYDVYKVIRYAPKTALQGTYEERPKNYIGNGDMTVCQAHSATATGTAATSGDDVVDRFRLYFNDDAAALAFNKWQDQSDGSQFALVADVSTANAAIAAGDYAAIKHNIEGYDFQALKDETITITFDVYGKAGTYCLALQNSDSGYSYIVEYTINSDSTWQTITKNITIDTSSGNWNYTNGIGLSIYWTISSGTTYQSTANSWVSGNKIATSNQDNGVAGTGTDYDFKLRNVALYKGSYTAESVPEFRPKNDSFADNLAECQRYYWQHVNTGAYDRPAWPEMVGEAATLCFSVQFPVEMRTTPTMLLSGSRGTDWSLVNNAGVNSTGSLSYVVRTNKYGLILFSGGTYTANAASRIEFGATTGAKLSLDARL